MRDNNRHDMRDDVYAGVYARGSKRPRSGYINVTCYVNVTLQYHGAIGYVRVVRTTDCGRRCCTTQS